VWNQQWTSLYVSNLRFLVPCLLLYCFVFLHIITLLYSLFDSSSPVPVGRDGHPPSLQPAAIDPARLSLSGGPVGKQLQTENLSSSNDSTAPLSLGRCTWIKSGLICQISPFLILAVFTVWYEIRLDDDTILLPLWFVYMLETEKRKTHETDYLIIANFHWNWCRSSETGTTVGV